MIGNWLIVRSSRELTPEYKLIIQGWCNQINLYRFGISHPSWIYYAHKELYFQFNNLRE